MLLLFIWISQRRFVLRRCFEETPGAHPKLIRKHRHKVKITTIFYRVIFFDQQE